MQIRNDYTSYQGMNNSRNNHNHYVTDGFYEEVAKKTESGAVGQGSFSPSGEEKKEENSRNSQNISIELHTAAARESKSTRKVSLARQFWDYLGDEKSEGQNTAKNPFSIKQVVMNGVSSVAAAFRQSFPYRIVNKWVAARENIKTGVTAVLKRFGRGREAFAALADGHMPSGKREGQNTGKQQKGPLTTRRGAVEVTIQEPVHNHLMDSYTKNGEYCQLNDHLSYRKPVSNRNNA